jgi:hypothetical protein
VRWEHPAPNVVQDITVIGHDDLQVRPPGVCIIENSSAI